MAGPSVLVSLLIRLLHCKAVDLSLIEYTSRAGKPMIISIGMVAEGGIKA